MKLAPKLILLTLFSLPLYLVKTSLGGLTLNLLDFLALLSIFFFLFDHPSFAFFGFLKRNKVFFAASSLLFVGLLLSFIFNQPTFSGLGLIISWFLLPFIFAFIASHALKNSLTLRACLLSLYFSATLVSIIALGYKALDLVTYDGRLAAFWSSPNYLAMFLAPSVFIGLGFLTEKNPTHTQLIKIGFGLSFLLILGALYFTFSYGAWLASLGALSLSLWVQQKTSGRKSFPVILAVIFLFGLFFFSQLFSPKLQSWLQQNPRSSLASRQMIWQASARIIDDHFLLGVGPGNFQKTYLAYQQFFPPYLEWAVPQPHNLYLAFWLQTGLLGITGFILLLGLIFKRLLLSIGNKNSATWTLLAFFLYLALHGLVDTPYWKNDLAYLFWLFVFFVLFLTDKHPAID